MSLLLPQASTHYGSVSSGLSHPGQVGGFSGHRLNIHHFAQLITSEVEVKESCVSFPYSMSPSFPQHLQETWATPIDTGTVTSIAPASFAPHVPVTPHRGQLVNVNGGEVKILGQNMVASITHKVVVNITFFTVEDVVNAIIGLDALH